jgi:hypothetical protein
VSQIYELPPARPGIGEGKWKRIAAATSQVDVLRQTTGTQLSLTIRPLALRVAFDTGHKGIISETHHSPFPCLPSTLTADHPDVPGVLHFQDIGKLKDHPEYRGRQMQADYAPSRIVFFAKNRKNVRKDYAIVSVLHLYVFRVSAAEETISFSLFVRPLPQKETEFFCAYIC